MTLEDRGDLAARYAAAIKKAVERLEWYSEKYGADNPRASLLTASVANDLLLVLEDL